MKKIIFTLMSVLLIWGTSEAQQPSDTTATNQKTKQEAESGQPTDMAREPRGEQPTDQPQRTSNYAGDMEVVTSEEIPQSLRNTLEQDEKYKGWENAIIYHNTRTDEYLLSPRPYRFNGEGKPIDGMNADHQQNRQRNNQQSSQQGEDQSSAYRQSPTDPNRSLDSSDNETASEQNQSNQANENIDQPQQQSNTFRNNEGGVEEISMTGMSMVEQNDYPEAIRETLQESKYRGWENGQMYHNESSGEYLLIIDDPANRNNGKKRHYRFDKNGEAIDKGNNNGN